MRLSQINSDQLSIHKDRAPLIKLVLLLIIAMVLSNVTYAEDKSYPKPEKTKNRIFYIQRNLNSNTIVYDAVFDERGYFIERNPINIYYINYNIDNGIKATLDHLYIFADNSRSWPKVKYIELFGTSLRDHSEVYEKIIINK